MPHLWPANPDPAEHNRRSVYLQMKRSLTLPMLQIFDAPDTATSCPRRETFHRGAAGAGADEQRVQPWRRRSSSRRGSRKQAGDDSGGAGRDRLEAGVRASAHRRGAQTALDYLKRNSLPRLCLLIFNMSEFIYVD